MSVRKRTRTTLMGSGRRALSFSGLLLGAALALIGTGRLTSTAAAERTIGPANGFFKVLIARRSSMAR